MPATLTPPDFLTPLSTDITPGVETLLKALNLRHGEYRKITQHLGRGPNTPELYMFSALWSEHCSYKHTKPHLKKLPTQGAQVVLGPGENAGIIQVGPYQVAFKVESHNHPTAIEPYQGATTGVGGILRDIITLNARPVALLNLLRFGPSKVESPADERLSESQLSRNAYLLNGAVAGIADYGNCMGIPTVAGDVMRAPCYSENPLVNAMAVGVMQGSVMPSGPTLIGAPVLYVGTPTGRDGLGGAAFASKALEAGHAQADRPAVQVGDPFMGKRLMESCLAAFALEVPTANGLQKAVIAAQDMGAAGLACALAEMSDKGNVGMRLDLDKVPVRQPNLLPHEYLLSETQERMLLVAHPDCVEALVNLFARFELPACIIGEVIEEQRALASWQGQTVVDLPPALLTRLAPVYAETARPEEPESLKTRKTTQPCEGIEDINPESASMWFHRLNGLANIKNPEAVFSHYDRHVGNRTLQASEHGGVGVIALEKPPQDMTHLSSWQHTHRIGLCLEGNARYVTLEPFMGSKGIVTFCARKLAAAGATPLAVTNNLNFGDPETPETAYQLHYTIEGIKDACTILKTPVTGGNVSLYNTRGVAAAPTASDQAMQMPQKPMAIDPTPTIGMVGHLKPGTPIIASAVPHSGLKLALIGRFRPTLGGSEYQWCRVGKLEGTPPTVALADENRLIHGVLPALIQSGYIQAARTPSLGGLAISLGKMLSPNAIRLDALGGEFDLSALTAFAPRLDTLLFGETHGCVVVAFAPEHEADIYALIQQQLPTVGTVSDIAFVPLGLIKAEAGITLQVQDHRILLP
jgi:phosphoribosylformylglycinamidine synthase II